MEVRTDFEDLKIGVEVLLFLQVGVDQTMCLARKHWFETEEPGQRRQGWQATYDGREIPKDWAPYAYCQPTPPDPALFDGGY